MTHDPQQLYIALIRCLSRRGLRRLAHKCEHCGKVTVADLLYFPEVKMAVQDAAEAVGKDGNHV